MFLAVTQEGEPSVRAFLRKFPSAVPIYLSSGTVPPTLSPHGFPTTFILSPNGNVVYREVGGADWNTDEARGYIRSLARTLTISVSAILLCGFALRELRKRVRSADLF